MTREEAIRLLGVIDTICTMRIDDYGEREHNAMLMAIEALGNDTNVGGKWIPCSERLPNSNGCYLVWRPRFFGGEIGMPAICYFDGQNTWHDAYGVNFARVLNESDVVAWQPLPEPYKGE